MAFLSGVSGPDMHHKHTKHSQHMRAKHLMARTGYASGGDVSQDKAMIRKAIDQHDDQLHGGKKTHLSLKTGGAVEGHKSGGRLDKLARGGAHHGKKKGKTHVTVNVLNHSGPTMPQKPMVPPMPMPPPPDPAMAGPPGGGPMPPPAMGPGGMKTGGRMAKRAAGGSMGAPTQGYSTKKIPEPPVEKHLARGGRLGGKPAPHMTGGAASGVGREEKAALEAKKAKPKAK